MRIRVKVDIRMPLKKERQVRKTGGEWSVVNFKYEKLGIFCFVCGCLGYMENKCGILFAKEEDDGIRGSSVALRAESRRQGNGSGSRWLREEKGSMSYSDDHAYYTPENHAESNQDGPTNSNVQTIVVYADPFINNKPDSLVVPIPNDKAYRRGKSIINNEEIHNSMHVINEPGMERKRRRFLTEAMHGLSNSNEIDQELFFYWQVLVPRLARSHVYHQLELSRPR